MSKKLLVVGILCLLLLSLAAAYTLLAPRSLSRWIAKVQRPGYQLLYSAESECQYFAIFKTDDDFLVLCESPRPPGSSTRVEGMKGEEVLDTNRRCIFVVGEINFGVGKYTWVDGDAIPIRSEYVGKLHILHREMAREESRSNIEANSDMPVALDVEVPWKPE